MLRSAPGSRSPALRESAVLEPAPDTHPSAIVHRGRTGTTFPLTPALSPRRGRPFARPGSIRASLLFGHPLHLRIPTAARGRGLLGWPQSGRGFSLSPRERDRVRGKRTDDGPMTFPSPKCVSSEGFTAAPLPAQTSTPEGRRPRLVYNTFQRSRIPTNRARRAWSGPGKPTSDAGERHCSVDFQRQMSGNRVVLPHSTRGRRV